MNPPVLNLKSPLVNKFVNRVVRDLAWALYAPPLFVKIDDWPEEWLKRDYIDDGVWPWLCQLDHDPTALKKHISQQKSNRLGIYFETLLGFYLMHYPRFELIAQNYQVNDSRYTLGEFDFIVYDRTEDCVIHIESAVKFYLGHKEYRGVIPKNKPLYNWHHWIGPNQKDTLAIKMRHLKERQLLLGKTPLGAQALNKINVSHESLKCRLLISGRFYFPQFDHIEPPGYFNMSPSSFNMNPSNTTNNIATNNTATNNTATNNTAMSNHSHWIDSHRFIHTQVANDKKNRYYLLPKQYWLSELTPQDILTLGTYTEAYTIKQAKSVIKQGIESSLAKNSTNEWQFVEVALTSGVFNEKRRFFVINSGNLLPDKSYPTH